MIFFAKLLSSVLLIVSSLGAFIASASCSVGIKAPDGTPIVDTSIATDETTGTIQVGFGGPVYIRVKNVGDVGASFSVSFRKKGASVLNSICHVGGLVGEGDEFWLQSKFVGEDLATRIVDVMTGVGGARLQITVFKEKAKSISFPTDLVLNSDIAQQVNDLVRTINDFQPTLDLSTRPEAASYNQSIRGIYYMTEVFLRDGGVPISEQGAFVGNNLQVVRTLIEIFTRGFDISLSFIPFVNDARDFYELISGVDLVTGDELDFFARTVTGVALIAGSGSINRKIVDKLKDSFGAKRILSESLGGIPGLTYTGGGSWESGAGLIYRRALKASDGTIKNENRLRHVFQHTRSLPGKTTFSIPPRELPTLLDQAWLKRGDPLPDDTAAFVVSMGERIIGTNGENKIKIVVKPGTNLVITAFPVP